MKIYNFTEEFKSRCELDLTNITSLDEYLVRNKSIKKLVYSYLKLSKGEKVSLSYLDEIFFHLTTAKRFNWKKHKEYSSNDSKYLYVYEKYVKVPYLWFNGQDQIQPYLFDAKHLLKGEYQVHANHAVKKMLNINQTHYVGALSQIRSLEPGHQEYYNDWFLRKRKFERKFFENILSKIHIEPHLKVRYYWKFIEIYDTVTTLTLQIEIKQFLNSSLKILMPSEAKNSSFGRRNTLAFKFLIRNKTSSDIYAYLINSVNLDEINKYIDESEKFETEFQFKAIQSNVIQILEDLQSNNVASSFDSEFLGLYLLQYDSIEKSSIHYSHKNKLLRYYRNIKTSDGTELKYASYNLPKNIERASKHLIMSGFINISPSKINFDEVEYQYMAMDNKNAEHNYSMQFLRTPIMDIANEMNTYNDYENQLLKEVELSKTSGIDLIFEDTRDYSEELAFKKMVNASYLDNNLYEKNRETFIENNNLRLISLKQRTKDFYNKNSPLFHAIENIIESSLKEKQNG